MSYDGTADSPGDSENSPHEPSMLERMVRLQNLWTAWDQNGFASDEACDYIAGLEAELERLGVMIGKDR